MDNTQLKAIATGALTGHWPAHLGLTTDAEKIEWLARTVEGMADEDVEAIKDQSDSFEDDLAAAEDAIKDIEDCDDCDLCDSHKKDS